MRRYKWLGLRYKHIDTSPRLIAVNLERQLLPGTFEHALDYLIDHELDLSVLDARYKNDQTGATAYPPALLLKIGAAVIRNSRRVRILFASHHPLRDTFLTAAQALAP